MTQSFFDKHETILGGALLFSLLFIIPLFGGKALDVYFGLPHVIFATFWYIGLIALIAIASKDEI